MNENDVTLFCDELNKYLKSKYGYKSDPAYTGAFLDTINTKPRIKFGFYLRWLPNDPMWEEDTLVIARIRFQKQRSGHGTEFLKFISNRAKKFKYKKIVIEMAHTDAIKSFASRFGFTNNECGYEKCWGISIVQLAKNLNYFSNLPENS